jgi:hypothetical protein
VGSRMLWLGRHVLVGLAVSNELVGAFLPLLHSYSRITGIGFIVLILYWRAIAMATLIDLSVSGTYSRFPVVLCIFSSRHKLATGLCFLAIDVKSHR